MIKIENIETYGWETAIRGMRNPMNSWDKSDTIVETDCDICHSECSEGFGSVVSEGCLFVGENDMKLMKSLFKGGTEHRKYLRFLNVSFDCVAPLYFFKEFDTYKIGTNCNSCSTMHKIHAKEFTLDDFSYEHLTDDNIWLLDDVITRLNTCRKFFIETKDKVHWWQIIQLLPTSYNQRRTIQMNYEVAVRIIEQRKNHKLDEWHDMVEVLLNLPYMKEIIGE